MLARSEKLVTSTWRGRWGIEYAVDEGKDDDVAVSGLSDSKLGADILGGQTLRLLLLLLYGCTVIGKPSPGIVAREANKEENVDSGSG